MQSLCKYLAAPRCTPKYFTPLNHGTTRSPSRVQHRYSSLPRICWQFEVCMTHCCGLFEQNLWATKNVLSAKSAARTFLLFPTRQTQESFKKCLLHICFANNLFRGCLFFCKHHGRMKKIRLFSYKNEILGQSKIKS